eukprot:scaffold162_cov474-Prasinococcus_capsulatus_cf.AAC.1
MCSAWPHLPLRNTWLDRPRFLIWYRIDGTVLEVAAWHGLSYWPQRGQLLHVLELGLHALNLLNASREIRALLLCLRLIALGRPARPGRLP